MQMSKRLTAKFSGMFWLVPGVVAVRYWRPISAATATHWGLDWWVFHWPSA